MFVWAKHGSRCGQGIRTVYNLDHYARRMRVARGLQVPCTSAWLRLQLSP